MDNFLTIDYLIHGTTLQQAAYRLLKGNCILETLAPYTPVLAGTIPINIAIEGSDLDILCQYTSAEEFTASLIQAFSHYKGFTIRTAVINGTESVISNFFIHDFELEIFGQATPVINQYGYRHMVVEHQILLEKGEDFRQQIISLKQQGYKTETAFAKLLGLQGNPYKALYNIFRVPNPENLNVTTGNITKGS
ncbi:MAG: DUF4269 domain-containing protein [Bacteroidota bacterium]